MGQTKEAAKHTPGPWTRSGGSIVGPDGRSIWNPQRGWDEVSANYDLVCRAPEMAVEIERLRGALRDVAAEAAGGVNERNITHQTRLADCAEVARAALEVNDGR